MTYWILCGIIGIYGLRNGLNLLVERIATMCYGLFSIGMFFNVLGIATWFYLCYKFGLYCADKGVPYVDAQYKKFLKNG